MESAIQVKKVKIDYKRFEEGFHEDMLSSPNPVRKWFHNSKNELVLHTLKKYSAQNSTIVDLGCGTVNWNTEMIPVIGIDLNKNMLQKAAREGRLSSFKVAPVERTGLESGMADIVVISEVLEHITAYGKAIMEIRRILKPGGICISTVPYDTTLSMWKPLFALQCFLHGTILGNEYFKNEAGHVNHFSPQTIARAFSRANFQVVEQFDNIRFTIFTVSRKK